MTGSVAHQHGRQLLLDNWFVCATEPDKFASPPSAQAEALSWLALDRLMPVAAALRASGQWSLNDAPRRFDAQDWWYRLKFDAPAALEGTRRILGLDGLATVAEVWLNGALLLTSRNMFIAHACDVSSLLRPQDNELWVLCRALDAQLAKPRPRPRWRAPMVAHQQLRWFRTTLLGRTPGWSPPAAVVGPWKDIWLACRGSLPEREDVCLRASLDGTTGVLQCRVACAAVDDLALETLCLRLERRGRVFVQPLACSAEPAILSGELRVDHADLWWPHTHGEPALYQASLQIERAGAAAAASTVIDLGPVGFRTLTVDTQAGEFSLHVNGVPVFCRGAVWTPLDPVSLRSSPEECRAALAQARAAGMNMLRVAGTMVYEEAHFYAACDAQGILVWQDFMFANMDYPATDEAFIASVTLEVRQQLQRLQGHACLAVLCGNSEVAQQAAMWGAARALWQPALFEDTLAQLCARHAPDIFYWPSSAHGGAFAHQASAGTTSYYGVGAYLRPLEDARRANLKFATECLAFANIPSASALARMPGGLAIRSQDAGWKERSPRDLRAGWDFDDVRDHYLDTLFQTDSRQLRRQDHDRYLTLGRMTTGEAMAASLAEWRRPASPCRGALVLFLRDLWAGAGWGLIDDAGVPKACYHYLKRVQQPLAVLLSDEGVNGLWVHLLNEQSQAHQVVLELCAWRDGNVRVACGQKALTLPARGAQSLCSLALFDHFLDLNHTYQFGPRVCDALVATLRDGHGQRLAQAFHFPAGLGAPVEADIGLSAQAAVLDDQTVALTVRTRRLARGVHIDVPGFEADDDFFHLAPDTEVQVMLRRPGQGGSGGVCRFNGSVHASNSLASAAIERVVNKSIALDQEALT